jgi:FixJ family two-component response regulator
MDAGGGTHEQGRGSSPVGSILVLDDSADLRDSMVDLLTDFGVEHAFPVASVAELRALGERALSTEVAILDVNLGAGQPSGMDAYQWLCDKGYHGRIVFMTGHALTHPLVAQALRLPNVRVIEKPIGVEEIATLCRAPQR